MRRLKNIYFFLFFFFCTTLLFAQGKSEKLVKKADEAAKSRDFRTAISLLKRAIKRDKTYGLSYLRLAGIYGLYQKKDSALLYYNQYVDNVPPGEIDKRMWLRIAELNFEFGNYQKAKNAIVNVTNPPKLLVESIDFSLESVAKGVQLNIEELPPAVNQYSMQYMPTLTVDENIIIYTKRDLNSRNPDEDIVISSKINGNWIPAQSLSKDVNTPYNEGACSISADGNTLIFTACEGRPSFGSCDLYITYRVGNKWAEPENLGSKVNSQYWDSQPTLSADGRTLYFASNRPGGYGKRDIWFAKYDGLVWTMAKNLGDRINTPNDETTPFIHASNELLFFSSDGYPGLGGLDLFLSEKIGEEWGYAKNLGFPINTHNDELSLFVNSTGEMAYYTKEKRSPGYSYSESKIFKFKIPSDTLVNRKASYITGIVKDALTSDPIGASFKMVNLNDTTDTYYVRSDSLTGKYFLVVTQGKEYGVFISKKGYLFEDLRFRARENTALDPDTIDILLDPIRSGQSVTLENIYFEFDDYKLDHKSVSELDNIADFILRHEGMRFKIEGHTDNQGSSEYNLILSKRRAEEVYNYLTNRGVSKSVISYDGLGDRMPQYSNETESGREMNRRITFTIISR